MPSDLKRSTCADIRSNWSAKIALNVCGTLSDSTQMERIVAMMLCCYMTEE